MTIANQENTIVHLADGIQTRFDFPYPVQKAVDLQVYINTDLQIGGYIVYGAGAYTGGYVLFAVPPPAGTYVTLIRYTVQEQQIDYRPYDSFPAEVNEWGLDKLTMITQDLQGQLRYCIKLPPGTGPEPPDYTLPPYDAGKGIMWDETSENLTNTNDNINGIIEAAQDARDQAQIYADNAADSATEAFGYAAQSLESAQASALSASESEASALASAESALEAGGYANDAAASELKASEWSDNPYNVEVEPGRFSSMHWSIVSENTGLQTVVSEDTELISVVNADQTATLTPHSNIPHGMVKLDETGQIPLDLIPITGLTPLGVYRGDDDCPKYGDETGDCIAPDYRNPSERFPTASFLSGHYFVISSEGSINLVDPETMLVEVLLVEIYDAIIFLPASTDPVRTEGWYLLKQYVGGQRILATNVIFDDTSTAIKGVNVQLWNQAADTEIANKTPYGHLHDDRYLQLTGGVVTGPIGGVTPTADNHLTRKDYVDTGLAGKSNVGHLHEGVYSPVGHLHDERYSLLDHDHEGVYSPVGHNHDGTYLPLDGTAANSLLLDGAAPNAAAVADTIAQRDANADVVGRYFQGTNINLTEVAADRLTDTTFLSATGTLYHPNTAEGMRQSMSVYSRTQSDGRYAPYTHEHPQYLLLDGGTMTGYLTLVGPPTADLHAATKAYVDAHTGVTDIRTSDDDTLAITPYPEYVDITTKVNVPSALVKLGIDGKIPPELLPSGGINIVGLWDASGGEAPLDTGYLNGDAYIISDAGTIPLRDPETGVSAPTAVAVRDSIIFLDDPTPGWYHIPSAPAETIPATFVTFDDTNTTSKGATVQEFNEALDGSFWSHNHDTQYAPLNHNHDGTYLKLTGGNLSGDVYMNNLINFGARDNLNAAVRLMQMDGDNHINIGPSGTQLSAVDIRHWFNGSVFFGLYKDPNRLYFNVPLEVQPPVTGPNPVTLTYANATYSVIGHNHDGVYSPVGHNHDGVYLPVAGKAADSALLNGAVDSVSSANVDTIVKRGSDGSIAGTIVYSTTIQTSVAQAQVDTDTIFYSSTDNTIRKNNGAGFRTSLGVWSKTEADGRYAPLNHNHDLVYLKLTGGVMSGHISGIAPTAAEHLTRKDYVDAQVNTAIKTMVTGDPQTLSLSKSGTEQTVTALTNAANALVKLDANGNIPLDLLPVTGLVLQGLWDASTGLNPSETDPGRTYLSGQYYIISVAGTININNPDTGVPALTAVDVRDFIIYEDGTSMPAAGWYHVENTTSDTIPATAVLFDDTATVIKGTTVQAWNVAADAVINANTGARHSHSNKTVLDAIQTSGSGDIITDAERTLYNGYQGQIDGKSPTDHNHDAVYASINHNHDATYSNINHNHDTVYLKLTGGRLSGSLTLEANIRLNVATSVADRAAVYGASGSDTVVYGSTACRSQLHGLTGALYGGASNVVALNWGENYASFPANCVAGVLRTPVADNDIVNKLYVDTKVGEAGGGVGVNIGTIVWWPDTAIPSNYLRCDTLLANRISYQYLFAVLGTKYGVGDGSTTFGLPPILGYYVRAVDGGSGIDPDALTRTPRADGAAGIDVPGSTQPDAVGPHIHTSRWGTHLQVEGAADQGSVNILNATYENTTENVGSTETRGKNIYMVPCIVALPPPNYDPGTELWALNVKYDPTNTPDLNAGNVQQGLEIVDTRLRAVEGGGGFTNIVTFPLAGTFQWSVPAGKTKVKLHMCGGGGGAAGDKNGYYWTSPGGGAGAFGGIVDVTPGELITIVIGAGGGVGAANSNGGAGGSSSWQDAATLTCNGGGGGVYLDDSGGRGGTVTGTLVDGGFNDFGGVGQQGSTGGNRSTDMNRPGGLDGGRSPIMGSFGGYGAWQVDATYRGNGGPGFRGGGGGGGVTSPDQAGGPGGIGFCMIEY